MDCHFPSFQVRTLSGQSPNPNAGGIGGPAECFEAAGEAVARGEGVGVIWTQDPFGVFEVLLVEREGLSGATAGLEAHGEAVARGEGVGVIWTQDPFGVFEVLLVKW